MSNSLKCNCGHPKGDHFNTIYLDAIEKAGSYIDSPTNCSECSCPKFIEETYEWDGRKRKPLD